jgi:ribosomal subunit interface protein
VDIAFKGRHIDVPERFREQAAEKLAKVERLDHKVMRVDVEIWHETNPRLAQVRERVELTCRSKGPVIRAEAAAADMFAALDLALDKLEARLRKAADRRRVHHGSRTPVSLAVAAKSAATAPVEAPEESPEDEPRAFIVREKVHSAEPMTVEQALHEMELVGHDFYLFADKESGRPSVVYRRRGYDYGVIRLGD